MIIANWIPLSQFCQQIKCTTYYINSIVNGVHSLLISSGAVAYSFPYFGKSVVNSLSNFLCYGNESRLFDCINTQRTLSCNSAGVRCQGENFQGYFTITYRNSTAPLSFPLFPPSPPTHYLPKLSLSSLLDKYDAYIVLHVAACLYIPHSITYNPHTCTNMHNNHALPVCSHANTINTPTQRCLVFQAQ